MFIVALTYRSKLSITAILRIMQCAVILLVYTDMLCILYAYRFNVHKNTSQLNYTVIYISFFSPSSSKVFHNYYHHLLYLWNLAYFTTFYFHKLYRVTYFFVINVFFFFQFPYFFAKFQHITVYSSFAFALRTIPFLV